MLKVLLMISTAMAGTSSHLPLQGSDIAESWDKLYLFLVWLSVFFFILVCGLMLYFVIKYRNRPGLKAKYITGNVPIEIVWTAIPLILLMVIFGWGYIVYRDMTHAPVGAYDVKVVGKQWLWQFQYEDGRTTINELYVPIATPIKLTMTSTDVLHSFFIPNFRVKSDIVPGMYTSVWFEANVPGKHQVFCTEYCGASHSLMLAKINVLTKEQWEQWKLGKKIENLPEAGEQPAAEVAAK